LLIFGMAALASALRRRCAQDRTRPSL